MKPFLQDLSHVAIWYQRGGWVWEVIESANRLKSYTYGERTICTPQTQYMCMPHDNIHVSIAFGEFGLSGFIQKTSPF